MSTAPARVLCVDDHPVVRAGLRALVGTDPQLQVVGEAEDEPSARAAVAALDPDIVVMDVRLGSTDGIRLTAELTRANPRLGVVVLSSYAGDEEVYRATEAGARGYVLKEFAAAEIITALNEVRRGNRYVSRDIAERLARSGPRVWLTPIEQTVLGEVSRGRENEDIAAACGLSLADVEGCTTRLIEKFGCENRTDLATRAMARGFLDREADGPRVDRSAPLPRGGLAQWQLKRAQDYMAQRIEDDVPLADVAALVKLSSFHFARAFKQAVGVPPYSWLTALRMNRAIELMRDHPNMGLTEVALRVGYQSQSAFGSAFRRHHGCTPGRWRREMGD
ncbi:MAG: hypothetical protein A4S16_01835 [Proteobacteria bacterium SG_bin6]|nr:MAG: hypothetical protein A4S16_01835 [Proteobacteria bacterium SG_bin6]